MRVFNTVDFQEWQEIAEKCEYATFFHTPAWARIFAQTYPRIEVATKKFVLDDGTNVILPLVSTRAAKGLMRNYQSMIPGVYGGVIAERRLEQDEINKLFKSLVRIRIGSILLTGNALFDCDLPEKFEMTEDFTHVITLGKEEGELLANYKSSAKNKISKGRRAGLLCREANDLGEWKEYYSIYQAAVKRWGDKATSNYPFLLFNNIFKTQNSNIKLWLVIHDGKIVGGNLNFYHNKHCVEWHASFLADYFRYGIRDFLVHNVIMNASKRGYKYYDFNPSGGHEGTAKFKEAFGPQKHPVKRWRWKNPVLRILRK